MISHVFIGTNDFPRALNFYSAIMAELGLKLKFSEPEESWAGWVSPSAPRPLFLVGKPYDGQPASFGNGNMTALLAATRATVDRVHQLAMSMGALCEGPPSLRPHYHANFYGAYFRDPDGNKICVCCHEPELP
ncbi:MAG: VOC family protein [Burkholderiaceae bacterium]|nr:VOC family protein [Burkholderiaceae bacterium]